MERLFDFTQSTANQVIHNLSGAAASYVNVPEASLSPQSLAIDLSENTTFAGVFQTNPAEIDRIGPDGGFQLNGNGFTFTLSGASTYLGPTTVTSGTLALGPGGSIGTSVW